MGLLAACKIFSIVSPLGHFVPLPALATVAGFAITPLVPISVACFLVKHPGKPMSKAQWAQWDATYKQYGLR